MSRNAKALKFKLVVYYNKKNPVELKHCKMGLLSDETKTSEGKVMFNFGI